MVELKFTDLCRGCNYASLELNVISNPYGQKVWSVNCTHHDACNQMAIRMGDMTKVKEKLDEN